MSVKRPQTFTQGATECARCGDACNAAVGFCASCWAFHVRHEDPRPGGGPA